MKKFFVAALVLCSAVVNASEVTVLDSAIDLVGDYPTIAEARFQMDRSSGEGFVKVSVMQERQVIRYDHYYGRDFPGSGYPYPYPGDYRMPMPQVHFERFNVFSDMVKVDGLALVGDKVMYQGAEGEVECGTLGVSRVLKVPTIYLSGKCQLTSKVNGRYRDPRVVVKLSTK
jgi:hypothetical protein